MFLLLNGSNIIGISSIVTPLVEHVFGEHTKAYEKFNEPNGLPNYMINSYNNAENYASNTVRNMKIIEVRSEVVLPTSNPLMLQFVDWHGNNTREDSTDVTGHYFRVEQAQYDGPQKVYATVTKRGLKSTGMTVIVDPNLVGRNARTPEQYEELMGTFAKVKVTTNINANGWYGATLFMSADSLGDYRVETQRVNGLKTTFLV